MSFNEWAISKVDRIQGLKKRSQKQRFHVSQGFFRNGGQNQLVFKLFPCFFGHKICRQKM
jgi:hypothetical protein